MTALRIEWEIGDDGELTGSQTFNSDTIRVHEAIQFALQDMSISAQDRLNDRESITFTATRVQP